MAGLVTTFGAGAMTNSIGEIRDVDMLFVIGSNTTEAHPIIGMEMKQAKRRGAKLVVADPRSIWLTTIADTHLKLAPGTDVWLLNAMAHVILEEGLVDREFIEANTDGFEALPEVLARYTPEEAEKVTGVPASDIREVAIAYAKTPKAAICYTLGITEHSHGTDNVYALSNLVLMTGHLGKASAGLNPLRGQNNVQGANDTGATPVFYPGYQRVDDPEVQAKYEAAWGVDLCPNPGLNLNEMMKQAGKQIRGMFVMGEDIVLSEPNVSRLEEGLNDVEFLVLQDIFPNETTRFADVVLPAACFAEKDGVFVNSERRMQRVRKAVEPPEQARADWEILIDLAQAAGGTYSYDHPRDIFAEMARHAPKFSGISYERIEELGHGIQWPCADETSEGTRYLHEGGILRGKGLFQAVEYRPSKELADDEYPLVLSTGRTLYHYNCATQTRRAAGLPTKQPEAYVELHPRDAGRRSIEDGDWVDLVTRRGSVRCRALVSKQVQKGCVWMPFHFSGDARANLLTVDEGDEVTGTAEYKVCAAEVRPVASEAASGQNGEPDPAFYPGSFYRE